MTTKLSVLLGFTAVFLTLVYLSATAGWKTAVAAPLAPTTVFLPLVVGSGEAGSGVPTIGPVHSGEGTYYNATGAGNCAFPASPQNLMVAAMNHIDYGTADLCGATIRVNGPKGSVDVRIVDQCPECPQGDVDLSREAFAVIADIPQGRVPITWQIISPALDGPISYYFKPDSSQWWAGIQIRNHRNPIAKFEYRSGNTFIEVPRQSYNFFEVSGMGVGPYTFRVTDVLGNVIQDSNIPLSPGSSVPGSSQFPAP